MRSGRSIRSELVSDRENRRASRQRRRETAFGVYRPLSEESCRKIVGALHKAKPRVDQHFAAQGGGNKYTELMIPKDYGVTYVRRDNVLQALKTSAMRNFSPTRAKTNIANYNYRRATAPTVPIEELDWFGHSGLKLVGKFAVENAEVQELAEDSEHIGVFLEEAGGRALDVYEPDHVTFCRFRKSRGGHDLSQFQKEDVQAIVGEEMTAARIGAVTLEEVVLASHGYRDQPIVPPLLPAAI